MGAGEKDKAATAFTRAIELDQKTVDARLNLAQIRVGEGKPDEARTLLEEVVNQHPDHYLAMLQLASLAEHTGDVAGQASWLAMINPTRKPAMPQNIAMAEANLIGPRL